MKPHFTPKDRARLGGFAERLARTISGFSPKGGWPGVMMLELDENRLPYLVVWTWRRRLVSGDVVIANVRAAGHLVRELDPLLCEHRFRDGVDVWVRVFSTEVAYEFSLVTHPEGGAWHHTRVITLDDIEDAFDAA